MDAEIVVVKTELHCTEGASNKGYTVAITQGAALNTYDLMFAYGRLERPWVRGEKLRGRFYLAARREFDKLINQKLGHGYRIVSGTRRAPVAAPGWVTVEARPSNSVTSPQRVVVAEATLFRRRIILDEED